MGQIGERHVPQYPVLDIKATGKNIRRIMESRKISVRELQSYLGLAVPQSIYHWFDGRNIPTIDNLYAMSELFRVPIDALIIGNRKYGIPARTDDVTERVVLYYRKIMQKLVA